MGHHVCIHICRQIHLYSGGPITEILLSLTWLKYTYVWGGEPGCDVAACQVPNGRPKWGTGTPKNIWLAERKGNSKPKYSWIAKTNSGGTSI